LRADDIELKLLAAIRAAPADEAPLRVYTDWLLERDDARGKYMALALAPGAPEHPSPRWVDELQPAALAAAAVWSARLGEDFRLGGGGFTPGLPSTMAFAGGIEALVKRAGTLAPLLVQPVTFFMSAGGTAVVRGDWRVLALVERVWQDRTHLVQVLELPSLTSLARREHRHSPGSDRNAGETRGVPLTFAFAPDADELRYAIDGAPQSLAFTSPAGS
jgi:uncharacterized protein (TIGR02996 family)